MEEYSFLQKDDFLMAYQLAKIFNAFICLSVALTEMSVVLPSTLNTWLYIYFIALKVYECEQKLTSS